MLRDPKSLLLRLSLEFSAAKDQLSAVDCFERYLSDRMRPASIQHMNLEKSDCKFEVDEFYKKEKQKIQILLAITIPEVFLLENCELDWLSEDEIESIHKIVKIFKERIELIAELRGLTYTDDLTGLYNQRYLELVLDRELSMAKRSNSSFSVLFLDLDHFKDVNDTHGHLIGSTLLYEVGQEIKKTLRESDITFRYGGDEFVIILSRSALQEAMAVAERIRHQIEKKRFLARDGKDIRLTASIGVACVPDHAGTKMQILKAADEALYGVKKAVRNKVIAATAKV